jgi:hypothetical protein
VCKLPCHRTLCLSVAQFGQSTGLGSQGSEVQILSLRPQVRGKAEVTAPGVVPEVDVESSPYISDL